MERIRGQVPSARELAEQTIAWITCAKRQLAIPELLHALAVEVGQPDFDEENLSQVADILSVCAGLVTVDEESGTIRLVHYTTQEYFARTRKDWFPDAETAITRACVSYLSFQSVGSGICRNHSELLDRLDMYKFYEYSACHWGHHAREALKPCPEVIPFLTCNSKVNASLQTLQRQEFRHSQALWRVSSSGLHLAVMFGLEKAVQAMLEEVDVNTMDSVDYSPLLVAAIHGQVGVIDHLLEAGASIEDRRDCHEQAPLSHACENGHFQMVNWLLDHGADIETKDYRNRTPLSFAAEGGHATVVKELLDRGAKLEDTDYKWGRAPISWAAVNGHTSVVQQLLNAGAYIESGNGLHPTPLIWAARYGQTATVTILLDEGADTEHRWDYNTPLHLAASEGRDGVVEELLSRGADIDSRDWYGATPLIRAATNGHLTVVSQLLNAGADPNAKDSSGSSPAYMAALEREHAIMDELLRRGADPFEYLPYREQEVESLEMDPPVVVQKP